ncbi:acetylglucosamine transferase [Paucibacter sp. KBW04]|uniref:O-linked N-acetylglucosamine transferase, SPINDLY family protein n=1 Tax=Paucibacter sp. KBW04 TaxID=2153361 RepID=UPI000F579E7A|nr:acetylglucosamine transferase [Paucibacter sp. KBW04]RQO58828.1 acetylglucosamine transferase [Paucibacter sp. KBW04]
MKTLSIPADLEAEWQQLLLRCEQSQLPLGELMSRAGQLHARGLGELACELYAAWLRKEEGPLKVVALYNMGSILGNIRKHAEAEAVYLQALAIKPDFLQARVNLGHQLEHLGRVDEALQTWAEAANDRSQVGILGTDPMELRLHAMKNRARLLEQQKRYQESEAQMRQVLELKPDQGDVLQHYVHIRQKQCAWPVYQPVGEVTVNQLLVNTSLLAMLSYSDDPALQLMVAQRFVNEKVVKYAGPPLHQLSGKRREGRIRIGYLSGDLCMHAVGLLTAELYELHDASRFELFAFDWSRDDGTPLRARILKAMDHHVRLHQVDDRAAAEMIAAAGIDVLVDLQGLTSGARPNILAYRPAPIQVGYLGLPATSALPGVDWIVADRFVMPPEYLPFCTEKPIYLPHSYQVSDRQREMGAMPTRAQYQLPEDAFVYCSFNNNHKFNEDVFASWMRVLAQVDKSVLWLLADNEWAKANMLKMAAAQGVAAERLIFAPRVAPPDYLARFQLADLFLDTFPYNAGTTASDCLWAGLPILTRAGRSYISRMAGSLLNAVGLPDLITFSLAEYEQRAVQIGQNPGRAASYKRYLREQGRQSALFDIPALVRDLEGEFEKLALAQRQRERV